MIARLAALAVTIFARALTGVRGSWSGCRPEPCQRVYFANHASHGDFILIWTVLPHALRRHTRPVAGADYWERGVLRRWIAGRVFQAVLVDRSGGDRPGPHPIERICQALDDGPSLIFFPEGTRNTQDARLLPLKSGLFHLARQRPAVEFVPVWIENLNRVMPKGRFVPIPLLCTVTFGAPIALAPGETKEGFLARATDALLGLARNEDPR